MIVSFLSQTPARFDDVIVKLPISVMFGDESEWEEEEKNRIIGNADIYGKSGEEDQDQPLNATEGDDINNDDMTNGDESVPEPEEVGSDME